jgi:ATP-dependent Clp protease ATP-binding subunit ClpC
VGSPPGYVGFDEGGQPTEAVRRRPYSVILFDEIEKAHPDVFNVLLQIFEEGRLTDAQGRKVDFKNAIIILTSNLGARDIGKGRSLGFSMEDTTGLAYDTLKERVTSELKKVFRPELLNRVDEVIVFHDLTSEDTEAIVDLLIGRLRDQLVTQGIGIRLAPAARTLLARSGFDPAMGARPLRRAIQRLIEDPLSEQLLAGEWSPGETVVADVDGDRIVFRKGEGEDIAPARAASPSARKATAVPRGSGSRRGTGAAGGAAGA